MAVAVLTSVGVAGTITIGGDATLTRLFAAGLKVGTHLRAGGNLGIGGDDDSFAFLYFGVASDVYLYRLGAGILASNALLDASAAGLRTKHEAASTPSGGNSGEVRVGTDKLWVNDGGTWKSTALAAAGAPSFASMAKWGTD